jgi:hypothetical protein
MSYTWKQRNCFRCVELSRNLVFMQKIWINVALLRHSTFDRAEPFLQVRETFWDACLFSFLKILYRWFLQILQHQFYSKKHAFFRVLSVFGLFYSNRKKIERNQKIRQSKVFLVSIKKRFYSIGRIVAMKVRR